MKDKPIPTAFTGSRFIRTPKQGKAIGSQSNKRLWHWWACFPNTKDFESGWRGRGSIFLLLCLPRVAMPLRGSTLWSRPLSSCLSDCLSGYLCCPLSVLQMFGWSWKWWWWWAKWVRNFCVSRGLQQTTPLSVKANTEDCCVVRKALCLHFG